jgi:putative Mn2+ efflux pump MntP
MTTGVGVATADAVYGAVGALGLASIAAFLAAHAQPIHIIAGVILFALGVQTLIVGMRLHQMSAASSSGPSR